MKKALKEKRYIAAVSGGPDSMALLNKYQKHIVGVCHVNYHKRPDSNHDQQIVFDYCLLHHIPMEVYNIDPKEYKKADQHNFQALARVIRYEFFVECGKKFRCSNLLIAHNLNDFLETAIMQERRHSLNFFYGIKPYGTYKNLYIERPLINEFKKDLQKYCDKWNVEYAIDSSNASDVYERNRVRKELSKLSDKELKTLYKKFEKRNKQMALVQKKVMKLLSKWSETNYSVSFIKKLEVEDYILNNLIYLYLKKYNLYKINHNKIKMIKSFILAQKSNQSCRLEDGIKLLKKDNKVKVVKHE